MTVAISLEDTIKLTFIARWRDGKTLDPIHDNAALAALTSQIVEDAFSREYSIYRADRKLNLAAQLDYRISDRLMNAFLDRDVTSLEDFCARFSWADVAGWQKIGKITKRELKRVLEDHGYLLEPGSAIALANP